MGEKMIEQSIKVFISYAHEDERLCKELDKHLALLKRQKIIDVWHERDISAGTEWEQEIDRHLNTAQIILLLISADFLASDYCYSIEMQRALARAERNEAYVIPILLRPVEWHDAPFQHLPRLPQQNKPVTSWPNTDEAFREMAAGIR